MGKSEYLGHISRTILLLLIAATLYGCAVKGTGPLFAFEEPKAGKAIVFHYRIPRGAGSAAQYDVLSNGTPLTTIGNGGFFKQLIEPDYIVYKTRFQQHSGAFMIIGHSIDNALANFKEAYRFDAEAGKVYYLRWGLGVIPKIEQIPEEEALPQLNGLRSFLPLKIEEKEGR